MKFDFESLSAEPMIYMLMHSGAFVCVLGAIFFTIGLLFGYATWGRYKRQTRQLIADADGMKDEIARLKRKVGEHSVKTGPAIVMATETIHMPKKEGEEGVTAADAVPAITAETLTTSDLRLPEVAAPEVTSPELPAKSRANIIKAKVPKLPAPAEEAGAAAEAPKAEAPPPAPELPIATAPAPASAEAATVIIDASELPPPARQASPLAAIIATPHMKDEGEAGHGAETLAHADVLPAVIELPVTPLPAVEIRPEMDPKLGLIYKTRPEKTDDLTALKGIAQVLEQRLHDFGIYTYAQIAAWNEDHIREFSSRLAFKDRIQREHWVEQAQQLVAKQAAA